MTTTKAKKTAKQAAPPRTAPPTPKPPADDRPLVLGAVVTGVLMDIPLADVEDPKGQPDRLPRADDAEHIAELARSIREVGQIQPVMVEAVPLSPGSTDCRYIRVFGRRRIAAAKLAGMTTIRAIVVDPLSPDQRAVVVAVENIQRKNLTAVEEHLGVWELVELKTVEAAISAGVSVTHGPALGQKITAVIAEQIRTAANGYYEKNIEALAAMPVVRTRVAEIVSAVLAKPMTWVRDRMYIGRLSAKSRQLVLDEKLPLTHAREISKMADPVMRDKLAAAFAAGGEDSTSDTEAGPLESLQEEVGRTLFTLAQVPWKLDVSFAGCRACVGCPSNSKTDPGLFDHGGRASRELYAGRGSYSTDIKAGAETAVCTDHRCFAIKMRYARGQLSTASKNIVDKKDPPKAAEILKPAAIKKRVEERKERGRNRTHTIKQGPPSEAALKKAAIETARSGLNQAMEERCQMLEPAIAKAIAAKPGLWSIFQMIKMTKAYEATESHMGDKARRAAEGPNMSALLKHLADPSWKAVLAIEKECGKRFGLLSTWRDSRSGMGERFAAAMGIELEPAPTIDDFLKAEFKTKDTSKPAKKVKKPKPPAKVINPENPLDL